VASKAAVLSARARSRRAAGARNGSAERERKRLQARIEELDLEQSVRDGVRLSDQLIQPLLGNRAVALIVDVDSVSSAGGCPSMSTRNRTEAPRTAGPMTR